MNIFQPYPSIENTSNIKSLEHISNIVPSNIVWNATEKIHGSNFSALSDGTTIKWGKRTSFLENKDMESFYNSHYVREKYEEKIIQLYKLLDVQYIKIYGEICGGNYNDIKTSHNKPVKGIQKGVYYSPDIEFIIFDIMVCNNDIWSYLSMTNITECCDKVFLKSVKILHSGALNELLCLDPTFQTTIPSYFGLQNIENNFAEGYVFKPEYNYNYNDGSRIILKHKSPRFSEKNDKQIRIPTIKIVTEEIQTIIDIIAMYVNINRINNVLSKHVQMKNKNKLIGLIYKDVLKDAFKDMNIDMIENYKKNRGLIIPTINFLIKELVKTL